MAKQDQPKTLLWFTVAAIALLVAGTGVAWLSLQSLQSRTPKPSLPTKIIPTTPNTALNQLQIYWLSTQDNQTTFVPRPLTVAKALDKTQLLQTALEQLLTQTPVAPDSSAIPPGTKLLSFKVTDNNIYLDLSQSFTEGGGSESMIGRLGQLIYTATSLDPQAPVWISVEGKPLETLGGEGLMISQPITRQGFDREFK